MVELPTNPAWRYLARMCSKVIMNQIFYPEWKTTGLINLIPNTHGTRHQEMQSDYILNDNVQVNYSINTWKSIWLSKGNKNNSKKTNKGGKRFNYGCKGQLVIIENYKNVKIGRRLWQQHGLLIKSCSTVHHRFFLLLLSGGTTNSYVGWNKKWLPTARKKRIFISFI